MSVRVTNKRGTGTQQSRDPGDNNKESAPSDDTTGSTFSPLRGPEVNFFARRRGERRLGAKFSSRIKKKKKCFAAKMQRPGGQGTAFSIDSLIGTPQPRPGHLLYTGYPMFMPYRPLVIPQALSHSPLSSGIPPLAPLASFAGRLTNTFCASLGQGVPSMVALTTTMPSFSDPPDSFYPPQELPGPRLSAADPGARRQESPHSDELHSRDKGSELLNFSETFQTISGKRRPRFSTVKTRA